MGTVAILAQGARATQKENAMAEEPQRICVNVDGKKKVHSTWKDGAEMVEEYDAKTGALLSRQRRTRNVWGKESDWIVEVGQPAAEKFDAKTTLVLESQENPIFMRKDLAECFQWRIRNLPYPKETYSVTIDEEKQLAVPAQHGHHQLSEACRNREG